MTRRDLDDVYHYHQIDIINDLASTSFARTWAYACCCLTNSILRGGDLKGPCFTFSFLHCTFIGVIIPKEEGRYVMVWDLKGVNLNTLLQKNQTRE